MIELRKAFTRTRGEEIVLLGKVFDCAAKHISFGQTLKVLLTGNPNSGKMLGVLSAYMSLSDVAQIQTLIDDVDEALKMPYGQSNLEISGQIRPFVFRHDSLQRLKPIFPSLRDQAHGGVMVVTAITDARYSKLPDNPKYDEVWKDGAEKFDCMIDIRPNPSRLLTAISRTVSRKKFLSQRNTPTDAKFASTCKSKLYTIEMDDQMPIGRKMLSDTTFRADVWDNTEKALSF